MQDIFTGYVVVSNRILRDTNGNSRGVGFARYGPPKITSIIRFLLTGLVLRIVQSVTTLSNTSMDNLLGKNSYLSKYVMPIQALKNGLRLLQPRSGSSVATNTIV